MAIETPHIFRIAPLLFPRKIRSLLPCPITDDEDTLTAKKELFEELNRLAIDKPWSLGFSTVRKENLVEQMKRAKIICLFVNLILIWQNNILVLHNIQMDMILRFFFEKIAKLKMAQSSSAM